LAEQKKLFLREASGLVRAVSPLKALFFNLASMTGGIVVSNFLWNALYPAAPTFGQGSVSLAQILISIPLIVLALIFVGLLTAMPRTGGDYVFTSRILRPYLGWIETWLLVFSNLAIIAFELLQINLTTSGFGTVMGLIYPGSAWSGIASFLINPFGEALIGIILIILMGLMSFLDTRRFHSVVTALAVLAVSGLVIQILLIPFLSASQFATNFQTYSGNTTSQVVNTALSPAGGSMTLAPLTFTLFGAAVGFALFNIIGYQYSAYIGGELKGGVKRNGLIAQLGSLGLYTILVWIILVPLLFATYGYNFLHAWSYLYFNAPSVAPLKGAFPSSANLGVITNPGLWPVWLYVTLVADGMQFALGPAYLFMTSRMVFAWAWDRMIPRWFGEISDRTHSPLRVYVILLIGGLIVFLMSFPPIGLNFASLAYYSILLSALTWILPGFNALLLPFRRKDVFESTAYRRKVAGFPFISWLAIIWLAIILPLYGVSFIQPLIASVLASPTWANANNTGLLAFVVLFVIGTILYVVSKSYHRRKGIDVDLIFKSIPPE
jgi:amino acid transporter